MVGAAGFIGSHLVERLLDDGRTVVGIDDLSTGRRGNLASLEDRPGFTFHRADVTEEVPVQGPIDWILHLGSPASPPRYQELPIQTLRVNSEGSRKLLDLADSSGAGYFFASTSEVYGDPLEHPQTETYWGNVNPNGPRSMYDEAKRYGEALAMAYHRSRGVDIRLPRIFNTYGPRMDPHDGRVVTNFIRQALTGDPLTIYGDGSQTRSFCFIEDMIEGLVRLLDVPEPAPVNLGNPQEITIRELAEKVLELTGSDSELTFEALPRDDPQQRRPDISKARELLDWEPRVSLEEGLERTIDGFDLVVEGRP